MYLEHFGLLEAPFRITPHTDFFFAGANRGSTLDALIYAITHDEGIVKVSGEVGSGKTMLCRVLMERLPATVNTIYLANPSLSRDDILYAIADELELTIPEHSRTSAVLRALQERLIALYGDSHQVVVLIDEAHAMPAETLEEIRLLSNLESNRHKLLQLVLFGQPELNDVLGRSDMRQLKERITHNFTLEPLVRDDIAHYVDFRLRAAGYKGPNPFNPQALKRISSVSAGLTRRINILCDKSLLAAFADNTHEVTPRHVQAAIKDSEFASTHKSLFGKKALGIAAAALALLVVGISAWQFKAAEPLPAPSPAAAPVSPAVSAAPPAAAPATPVAATPAPEAPPPAPPAPVPVTPAPQAIATTAPQTPAPTPAPATPVVPTVPTAPPPEAAKASPSVQESAPDYLGPLASKQLQETRRWLAAAPDYRWFIQLLATDHGQTNEVEHFLKRMTPLLEKDQVKVYVADIKGRNRIGVIYGDYPNKEAAQAAIAQLPPAFKSYRPYPRQVLRLR